MRKWIQTYLADLNDLNDCKAIRDTLPEDDIKGLNRLTSNIECIENEMEVIRGMLFDLAGCKLKPDAELKEIMWLGDWSIEDAIR